MPNNNIVQYRRIFPQNKAELEAMLADAESTPLTECTPMQDSARQIQERLGW